MKKAVWWYGVRHEDGRTGRATDARTATVCRGGIRYWMTSAFRFSEACTCGTFRSAPRYDVRVADEHRCDPCKAFEAAKAELDTSQKVTFGDSTYFYWQEP